MTRQVKILIGLVIAVSIGFNAYTFGEKYINGLRLEGYNVAVNNVIEVAKKDGKLVLNFKDTNGKDQVLNLVVVPEEQPKK